MENDLKNIQNSDPLKRIVERQTEKEELSPMDPPEAYAPPNLDVIPYEDMHPLFQQLMDEHKKCVKELDAFEDVLLSIKQKGIKQEFNKPLGDFFEFIDKSVVAHNLKEEKILFPDFQKILKENGQHSNGPEATTVVDMLEDDHIKLMQLSAVTFNFFGLAGRLPDPASSAIVLDAAIEQGRALVEILKLHIFREDNVVFVEAQNMIDIGILDEMFEKL
jgi:hemerythrin-like domain-containing protein